MELVWQIAHAPWWAAPALIAAGAAVLLALLIAATVARRRAENRLDRMRDDVTWFRDQWTRPEDEAWRYLNHIIYGRRLPEEEQ